MFQKSTQKLDDMRVENPVKWTPEFNTRRLPGAHLEQQKSIGELESYIWFDLIHDDNQIFFRG